jgi:hypothetical protein
MAGCGGRAAFGMQLSHQEQETMHFRAAHWHLHAEFSSTLESMVHRTLDQERSRYPSYLLPVVTVGTRSWMP